MSWIGNKAVLKYADAEGRTHEMTVEAAFGDLNIRFLQAIPTQLGAMPFRVEVRAEGLKGKVTVLVCDVTDIAGRQQEIKQLADSIREMIKKGGVVTFRNGSGTKIMKVLSLEVGVGASTPDEAGDPSVAGSSGFTGRDGLRSQF